ncbi:hypothetical protein [Nocardia sp. NPDC004722]
MPSSSTAQWRHGDPVRDFQHAEIAGPGTDRWFGESDWRDEVERAQRDVEPAYRGLMEITEGPVEWVPDACTLPTADQPLRVAEFDRFFAEAVRGVERPDRTRLELIIDTGAESRGRELAARETECCSFFTFSFEGTGDGSMMCIDVPAAYVEVLDALEVRLRTTPRR